MFSNIKIKRLVKELGDSVSNNHDIHFIDDFLSRLNISYSITDAELKNIPKSGPFVVLANHPFAFLDSLILLSIFKRSENDFRVLADIDKKEMKAISNFFIEPGGPSESGILTDDVKNGCLHHLKQGNSLAFFLGDFSAAEESYLSLINLITEAGVPVVPLYFYGSNSVVSNIVKMLPASLRAWVTPGDFNSEGTPVIKLRIGKSIEHADIVAFANPAKSLRYLRACIYALGSQVGVKRFFKMNFKLPRQAEQIIDAVPVADIEAELETIRNNNGLLQAKGNYEIYIGQTELIPNILREIGRLRELTFREVGEGTGQKLDLDGYDLYYNHLFVWDKEERSIIGAYRLGRGKDIVNQYGARGFYVTSLFTLDAPLLPVLEKTLELGRSFVVKKYQQKPLPLFLLWQGILCFLRNNKEYQYLMGPVSISNDFSRFSKDLMIAFIRKHYFNNELARHVHPRQEFVAQTNPEDIDVVLERSSDLQQLDKFISSIEPNYLKVPVLLKQYIRQNAKIIAFNVDPLFNNCLDGLMILDLNDVPEETYEMLQSR